MYLHTDGKGTLFLATFTAPRWNVPDSTLAVPATALWPSDMSRCLCACAASKVMRGVLRGGPKLLSLVHQVLELRGRPVGSAPALPNHRPAASKP